MAASAESQARQERKRALQTARKITGKEQLTIAYAPANQPFVLGYRTAAGRPLLDVITFGNAVVEVAVTPSKYKPGMFVHEVTQSQGVVLYRWYWPGCHGEPNDHLLEATDDAKKAYFGAHDLSNFAWACTAMFATNASPEIALRAMRGARKHAVPAINLAVDLYRDCRYDDATFYKTVAWLRVMIDEDIKTVVDTLRNYRFNEEWTTDDIKKIVKGVAYIAKP